MLLTFKVYVWVSTPAIKVTLSLNPVWLSDTSVPVASITKLVVPDDPGAILPVVTWVWVPQLISLSSKVCVVVTTSPPF